MEPAHFEACSVLIRRYLVCERLLSGILGVQGRAHLTCLEQPIFPGRWIAGTSIHDSYRSSGLFSYPRWDFQQIQLILHQTVWHFSRAERRRRLATTPFSKLLKPGRPSPLGINIPIIAARECHNINAGGARRVSCVDEGRA
jgi:hypothetical protein